MTKILRVGMHDENTLNVQFENDSIILLHLKLLSDRPKYKSFFKLRARLSSAYKWGLRLLADGPNLTIDEIVDSILKAGTN